MTRRIGLTAFVALALVALLVPAALAEKKQVKPAEEIKGSVADADLAKDSPKIVVSDKGLENLWKKWKLTDKMPKVDFEKNIVVIATTVGSRINNSFELDTETGNLSVKGIATSDFGQGFRYVLYVVPKEGVKTIDNKELPKE